MIYLCSPYSDPDPAVREARFQAACKFASEMMRAGSHVLSPIAHTHPIALYGLPKEWAFWEEYDAGILAMCSEMVVLMLDGWEESVGIAAEVKIAEGLGMRISYLDPPFTG